MLGSSSASGEDRRGKEEDGEARDDDGDAAMADAAGGADPFTGRHAMPTGAGRCLRNAGLRAQGRQCRRRAGVW